MATIVKRFRQFQPVPYVVDRNFALEIMCANFS